MNNEIKRRLTDLQRRFRQQPNAVPLRAILGETSWLASAKLVSGFANFAASAAIARSLGPGSFGSLSLAVTLALTVGLLSTLGMEQLCSRDSASFKTELERNRFFQSVSQLRLVGALIGLAFMLVVSQTQWADEINAQHLIIVLCLLPIAQIGDINEWRLVSVGRSREVALSTLIVAPSFAVLRLIGALVGCDPLVFCWIVVAEVALRSQFLARFSGAELTLRPKAWDPNTSRKLVWESLPMLLSAIAVTIYMRLDQFMLSVFWGATAAGWYVGAVIIYDMCNMFPLLLFRTLLPELSKREAASPNSSTDLLVFFLRHTFLASLILATAVATGANFVITFLFGSGYIQSAPALQIF